MVFSGYSMPLTLAVDAQSWDGDIIAEDHHAYLKTFFYSAHTSATQVLRQPKLQGEGCQPKLQVRPIFLPVKSTSVISTKGYWQTYLERWHQAKRHAQGMAELPYAMLAMWDALCTLPLSTYSFFLFWKMSRILGRLFFMHILPVCQGIGFAVMTIYWILYSQHMHTCPENLNFWHVWKTEYPLCALGGAQNLIWPVLIPFACIILANYSMVSAAFLMPSRQPKGKSLWHKEDGSIYECCGSKAFGAFVQIATDCIFCLSIMMVPYGLFACLLATVNVCIYGNRFTYVTAAKAVKGQSTYGTMTDAKEP